ncbi:MULTISPECIES: response regulator [unclassified Oceanispirochaeta]|uniref:response regulator n=1 Tax=unclassified Oceanispirochaeta TaxID=2635722 RepID=UPI000E08F95F|nr:MULTISPECIES: response regulator [unclassified Oceanispirochaeta]MBF9018450.1 response regulator [Oceanispirochaeta sp. M2]NPD73902.1 response regulator [Oceanispirochaeta sp. M1]RDG30361.1 response regulator [Oceanispirochaeta sp. M1]
MLAIIPVLVVLFSISTLTTSLISASVMKKQAREHAQHLSRNYSEQLNSRLLQNKKISEDLGSAVLTSINIETTLQSYSKRYPQYVQIVYTPLNGKILEMSPYKEGIFNLDISVMKGWQQAVSEKQSVLSAADRYFGYKGLVFFSPVTISYVDNQEASVVGVVAILLPLNTLFADITDIQMNQAGVPFVIDQLGKILHHDNQELILTQGEDSFASTLSEILRLMSEQKTGFATYSEGNEKHYISFSPIPLANWSMGVQGNYSDITDEIVKIIFINFLILFLAILSGTVLLYFIVHSVVRPIENLTLIADKIARGDRTVVSGILSNSEVGKLSAAFDFMLSELRDSQMEIEQTVDQRTMELQRTNDELGQTVEELNEANITLLYTRDSLETRVRERTAELEETHDYIDSIINSMPSVIIGVNSDGIITQWNRKAESVYKKFSNDVLGKPFDLVLPEFVKDYDIVQSAVDSRMEQQLHRRVRQENYRSYYDDITVFPLISNDVNGVVIRIDDVTENVTLEQSLRQSHKMDAIGQMAGGIAHDFNNMLSGILGGAELLKSYVDENETTGKYLSLIIESARRASDLTGNLLMFSRQDAIDMAPVDLNTAIQGAVSLLEHSLDKNINIKTQLFAESSIINGNLTQLQNIFLNIGLNASHAMPEGGDLEFNSSLAELDASYCDKSPFDLNPGLFLEVNIRDTGSGMPPDQLERIFEPFYTTKKMEDGTGLGLAAVYGTVQQHKGVITVVSETGKGSTFSLYFPLSIGTLIRNTDQDSVLRGEGCILVVDDESVLRETYEAHLIALGYEVILAENGREGLEIYGREQKHIDLVILDMIMPEMNGLDSFLGMKEIDPEIKAILISGYSNEYKKSDFLTRGFLDYLQKPVEIHELSRAIADCLKQE